MYSQQTIVLTLAFVLISGGTLKTADHGTGKAPQHIHISYGDLPSQMIITWSTPNKTDLSSVHYGRELLHLVNVEEGSSHIFVDGGTEKRSQYIHRVDLKGLTGNTTYYYKVRSEESESGAFYFRTMPEGQDWSPRLAVFGDMGATNAQSLPRLELDAAKGMYDAVIHVGDFAYDLSKDNGKIGDQFMQEIQSLAASVPYMTCVGNHENSYNFSNYRARFNMPNDNGKMYYSFNMGPVHFVSISTEFLYFPDYGFTQIYEQYDWLKKDLMEANQPENRSKRPWIVTFGHRPMYCSNNDNDDCTSNESLVRVGVPLLRILSLEDLYYQQGVDLSIWAHEHSYERLWPVYNLKVRNGSYESPYTNPGGITHIITGSAGCSERHEYFQKNPPPWSAYHSSDYGYTRMTFANKTHLYVEQVSDDKNGEIIDSFTLIKEQHGPYGDLNNRV
ncbi:acid phosphatase type 7 isoform X2 [Aplysia californica]|nr:acid phosphatase type 7 isoform X2 [Aplysia californica]